MAGLLLLGIACLPPLNDAAMISSAGSNGVGAQWIRDSVDSAIRPVMKDIYTRMAGVDPADAAAVAHLIEMCRSADREVRLHAVSALGQYENAAEAAVPVLVRIYQKDPDGEVGAEAAAALGCISSVHDDILALLLGAAKQPEVERRRRAVVGLGKVSHSRTAVKHALLVALDDDETAVRAAAATALPADSLPAAITAKLQERLATTTGPERFATARLLSRRRPCSREVISALVQGTRESDPSLRDRALLELGTVLAVNHNCTHRMSHQALDIALDGLASAVASPDDGVRSLACFGLKDGKSGNRRSMAALARALLDSDTEVRRWAAYAIGDCAADAVQLARFSDPALRAVVSTDGNGPFVIAAAYALWRIERQESWVSVIVGKLLQDPDEEVRSEAVRALFLIGSSSAQVIPALEAAKGDKSEDIRDSAKNLMRILAR